jgi:hypothetical protein
MPRCPGIQMPNWNFSRADNPCRVFEETMHYEEDRDSKKIDFDFAEFVYTRD